MKLSRHLRSLVQKKNRLRHGFKIAALLTLLSAPAHGATLFWDADGNATTATGGTGTWDLTLQEWRNGSSTGALQAWTDTTGTTDTADFAGTAGTVTLGVNLGALGMIFDTAGYTVATGANVLTLGTGGITANNTTGTETISGTGGLTLVGAQTWNVATGGTLAVSAPVANGGFTLTTTGGGSDNISGVISGTGGLTVNSTGVTTLSGNNTYSGATTIGAGAGLQITAAATQTYGATGAVTDNGTLYLSPATGTTMTYGAAIGGTGVLNQFGLGVTSLTGANTYSGVTTITRGNLQFNAASTFSQNTTGITVASGGTLNFAGDGNSVTIPATAPLSIAGGGSGGNNGRGAINVIDNNKTLTVNAPITLTAASNIGAFGINSTTTLNGVIGGAFALTFNPDGGGGGAVNFNLNGANTFAGAVNLQTGAGNASTYTLGNVSGLGASTNVVGINAQNGTYALNLQLNALSPTLGGLNEASNTGNGGVVSILNNSTATASTLTLNVATGGNYSYYGHLGGTGAGNNNLALTKSGVGTQILFGSDTLTGAINVNAGILGLGSVGGTGASIPTNSSIPAGSAVTVANGAQLYLDDTTSSTTVNYTNFPLSLNGGTSLTFGNGNISTFNLPGAITLTGTNTIQSSNIRDQLNLTGAITGTGNLIFAGAGAQNSHILQLSNAGNTYAGTTGITATNAGATLQLSGGANRLPVTTVVTITASATNPAQLDLNGTSQTLSGLVSAGTVASTAVVNSSTTTQGTLTINDTANYTFAGILGAAAQTQSGTTVTGSNVALIKNGAGTETLNGASLFTGGTTINAGSINLLDTGVLGTGAITVASGGNLTLQNRTALAVGNALNLTGPSALFVYNSSGFNFTGAVTLGGDTTIRSDPAFVNGNVGFTNAIGGAGNLTFFSENGNGTTNGLRYVLSGASTYTGNTTITSATGFTTGTPFTVQLSGGDNRLPVTTSLTFGGTPAGATTTGAFNQNANLELNGVAQTLTGLSVASGATGTYRVIGTSATASTLTVSNAAANTFGGIIGGTGANNNNVALTKGGAGILTLTGANTYTGATTLNAGTLLINGNQSAATGAVTVTGGALGGTGTIGGAVAINAGAVSPGNSAAGTLTMSSSLTLAGGTALQYDLTTPGTQTGNDVVLVTGALTLGGTVTLNLNSPLTQTGTYLLIGYNGAAINTALLAGGTNLNGVTYTFQTDAAAIADPVAYAHELDLVVTAVPEPGTYVSLLVFGLAGGWLLRRRAGRVRAAGVRAVA